ncbi:MAG: hypothetical protein K9L30_17790 [Desulfobacterales bacterium]|nr:hypothetical protein [Desulfobacterales bacterium]
MKTKKFISKLWVTVAFIAIFSLGIAGCSTKHSQSTGDHPTTSEHPAEEKPASDHPES